MSASLDSVDVLVWGGGTGGVAAAIQAARGGASTLLLTPGSWLGGMVSAAGVCCPDGNELTPWQTGLWGAFLRELERREPEGLDHNWVSCFGYRPTTAEQILQSWVAAEPSSDLAALLQLLQRRWDCEPLAFAAGLRFGRCHSPQLQAFEQGFVKEGVGAGGLAALWQLSGRSPEALAGACDQACALLHRSLGGAS